MKFVVAVDLEGLACVVGEPGKGLGESSNFEMARLQGTREANAAARALFDSGATEVIIWDNHGGSLNLLYDKLDERCKIALGVGAKHRWPGMDESFSGVVLIGYHAMDNTADAVLAHTFSSKAYQWYKVNGVEVGEMAIDAAVAGEMNVPVIFASSDDKGVAEAKHFMPWIETVTTKVGMGWNLAVSKHPERAVKEIYEGVKNAVSRISEMKPFSFSTPITLQYRFKRLDNTRGALLGDKSWREVDPFTVEKVIEKISDQF